MSAIDVLSETELEVRDALPMMCTPSPRSMPGMCFTGARHLKIPPTDEMRQRMKSVAENGLPWLVAVSRHCGGLLLCHPLPPATRLSLYP
jgi:phosphinothricin acetyltransferase